MNQLIQDFIELFRLDLRISALDGFLEKAPSLKEEIESEKKAEEEKMESKRAELDLARQNLKKAERDLEDGEAKLGQIQAKLNQVKTNKEYDAALKEIDDQKKKNGDIEERILILYDEVEAADKAKKELESKWGEKDAGFKKRLGELDAAVRKYQAERDEKASERDQRSTSIPGDVKKKYEDVKGRTGRGLANADKEICQGCFRQIPAQQYNEVLTGEQVVFCPYCLRVLVHVEEDFDKGIEEVDY